MTGGILTPGQRSALQALADGLTLAEYGYRNGLATSTVKFHLSGARRRLNASTTVRAVVLAIEHGEISSAGTLTVCRACNGTGLVVADDRGRRAARRALEFESTIAERETA
jgi:DNA-binding CsgD family transcriptional regulator